MTRTGYSNAIQRGVGLALGVSFVATLGALPVAGSVALAVATFAVFLAWPRPPRPDGALVYARGPAVIGPDLIAVALVSFFIGLPIIAGRSEGTLLHPSLALMWPMAAVFLSLFVVSWRRSSFALVIGDEALEIDTGWRDLRLPYAKIRSVAPWRRDLVRRMRPLAPMLVSIGQPGAAGALLVARESRGITLDLGANTKPFVIPGDVFKHALGQVIDACAAHGVAIAPGLGRPKAAGGNP